MAEVSGFDWGSAGVSGVREKGWVAMKEMVKPDIRWMINRDIDDVMQIEIACFEWQDRWCMPLIRKIGLQRNVIRVVITDEAQYGKIVGFMFYELHPKRLELLRFAVDPSVHRKGYGAAMMQRLINKLSQQNREVVGVDVPEHNVGTQIFLSRCGFKAVPAGDFIRMEYWI